jgi:hypothetical protein
MNLKDIVHGKKKIFINLIYLNIIENHKNLIGSTRNLLRLIKISKNTKVK